MRAVASETLVFGVMVFDNTCDATVFTFSVFAGTHGCSGSMGWTDWLKCNGVWWRLLHSRHTQGFVQFFTKCFAQFEQRFYFLIKSKHWDGVCFKNIEYWYNRWFILQSGYVSGMIDAVCQARAFLLDIVWDFSFEDVGVITSSARIWDSRNWSNSHNAYSIVSSSLSS